MHVSTFLPVHRGIICGYCPFLTSGQADLEQKINQNILFFVTQHTAKEGDKSIVDASFKLTHWSVAPFGTGASRTKNMGFVFGGDVLRFYHGGDECLTVPSNWSDQNNMVIYEGGAVLSQARSLWRLDLIRTKWAGGFINWGYPVRITHITSGRYLGINESDNSICLVSREDATVSLTSFCVRADKDDKKIEIDEKEEEVIGSPLIKYGDTSIIVQHLETGFWLSYRSYETKKRGVGRVEEKQVTYLSLTNCHPHNLIKFDCRQ